MPKSSSLKDCPDIFEMEFEGEVDHSIGKYFVTAHHLDKNCQVLEGGSFVAAFETLKDASACQKALRELSENFEATLLRVQNRVPAMA